MCGKNKNTNDDIQDESEQDSDEEMDEDDYNKSSKRRSRSQKQTRNEYVMTRANIAKFGDKAMNYFRIPPRPTFLLGSLDKEIQLTQKKVRQRRVVDRVNSEEVRTKIKELDVNSKDNETSTTVSETERIFKILKRIYKKFKENPVCLYEFMINPHSFSRTIENIFYVSFLVKVNIEAKGSKMFLV